MLMDFLALSICWPTGNPGVVPVVFLVATSEQTLAGLAANPFAQEHTHRGEIYGYQQWQLIRTLALPLNMDVIIFITTTTTRRFISHLSKVKKNNL